MPIKLAHIAFAAVALTTFHAHASIIASDFFNPQTYGVGDSLYPYTDQDVGYGYGDGPDYGVGFTTGWEDGSYTSPRTIAAPLSYAGLATSGNGAASPAYVACTYCVNSTALRYFSANTATTDLWVSFLIRDDGVDAQDFAAYPNYGGFAVEDASDDFLYVGVPGLQPTSTADYSLQTDSDAEQGAVAASPGQTDLLVLDLRDTGQAYLYVDPTVGQTLGAPDATIATPITPSGAAFLYWSDSWGWTYGDLRVGTTLADITPAPSPVPEPADWTLLLAGFAGLGVGCRARRRAVRTAT